MHWITSSLDRNSPVPLYYQLAELIKERIAVGELRPGDQLPAERELAEQSGISRMTARQAIAFLMQSRVLIVRHGAGTFVAEPKLAYNPRLLLGFSAEMQQQGLSVTSRVLEQAVVAPPERVRQGLDLAHGAAVTHVVRLRLLVDSPVLVESSFIPTALCPGLEHEDLATHSLYTVLHNTYGLRLGGARQTLEAVHPNIYERQLFGVAAHMPMILQEGVVYLEDETPAEYFRAVYRGDRFKFQLENGRESSANRDGHTSRISVVLADSLPETAMSDQRLQAG